MGASPSFGSETMKLGPGCGRPGMSGGMPGWLWNLESRYMYYNVIAVNENVISTPGCVVATVLGYY